MPEGTSPYIEDSIRRQQMLDAQQRALSQTAAELGTDVRTLRLAHKTKHKRPTTPKPTPEQLLKRTPQWRAAHTDGDYQQNLAELRSQDAKTRDNRWRTYAARRARLNNTIVEPINRQTIIERDNRTCHLCGTTHLADNEIHIDHVIPLARGGEHTERNLKVACAQCNLRKGASVPSSNRATVNLHVRNEPDTNE